MSQDLTISIFHPPLGARHLGGNRAEFCVWAPGRRSVGVRLLDGQPRTVPLRLGAGGYHAAVVEDVPPGTRFFYVLDGALERPDPASRFQPEGVHGPSEVTELEVNPGASGWFGRPLRDYVLYELHVGTFTREGTFEAIIPWLSTLRQIGITALELMPVAQFPGSRNWGYDGAYPFAVQESYGGPKGLQRLVGAAHEHDMAVVLDVVYNHLGPEGNYLGDFGPYFTQRYQTPWGAALNFDGPESDAVRHYFIENALYWLREFHIDALRLDAVHAICDSSAEPFLQELATRAREEADRLNRRFHLIAESDLNDVRLILPRGLGGYGLDGQWSDDFHHALHVLLTGERSGYYEDFDGLPDLARVCRHGYAYAGRYSKHRKRRHGNSPALASARQFVVCSQNHDQVGNRMQGERLTAQLDFPDLKLAAGAVAFSPFIPLLFMGEEYGEPAPFQYFTSHTDPELIEAVRAGRKREFAAFAWTGDVPDPQHEETFARCRLNHSLREQGKHEVMQRFYSECFRLRRELGPLATADKERCEALELDSVLSLHYTRDAEQVWVLLNFAREQAAIELPLTAGWWERRLDSAAAEWEGPGSAVPARFEAAGPLALTLGPRAVVVLARRRWRICDEGEVL